MTTITTRHPITLHSGFTFYMIKVPGGIFRMGDNEAYGDEEDTYDHEKIINHVQMRSFWMAEFPTTQQFWLEVIGGENPSYFQGVMRPVEQVSWYHAAAFCNTLNVLRGYKPRYFVDKELRQPLSGEHTGLEKEIDVYIGAKTGGFRLPSEAEWEYAARSSNRISQNQKYAGSNNLDEAGWYNENSHRQTQPVGLKMPNDLGLYDLNGNVWEWCEDQWHDTYEGAPLDGLAWIDQEAWVSRVIRGGDWNVDAQNCCLWCRGDPRPGYRDYAIGFRIVFSGKSGLFQQIDWDLY